jgi:ATP-binding cassette subfamily B protein
MIKNGISVFTLMAIYIALVLIGGAIDFYNRVQTNALGETILEELRKKVYRYSQLTNITFHNQMPAGKMYARIINDVDDVSAMFKDVIATLFRDLASIIIILTFIFIINWKIGLMLLIVLPFTVKTSKLISDQINKIYKASKIVRAKINTFLAESIYGAKVIKIFNIQQEKQKELEDYTLEFKRTRVPASFFEALLPSFIYVLQYLSISVLVYIAALNIFNINLNVGVVYVLVNYITYLYQPINNIVDNIETIQDAVVSINRLYDMIEETEYIEQMNQGKSLKNVIGKLEFRNVWFAYKGENWVLKNISFVIEPGETIALVGKTGAGKTTIINLVNRFYEIQKGEILLDGVNINEYKLKDLRKRVGIVLQDPFIFYGSIKDNVKLHKKITDSKVKEAIRLASAESFVDSQTNGINELAQERGENFSAGQKQLIAFARIFAHNPDIFILDEATANIDTNSERLIQKSINVLSKEKTAIFIAHRLATIVNVDKILVLKDGEIIEEGKHSELLELGGYYSKLYTAYYQSNQ